MFWSGRGGAWVGATILVFAAGWFIVAGALAPVSLVDALWSARYRLLFAIAWCALFIVVGRYQESRGQVWLRHLKAMKESMDDMS